MIASKRILVSKLLFSPATRSSISSVVRSFNTSVQMSDFTDQQILDADRRSGDAPSSRGDGGDLPDLFSAPLYSFSFFRPTRSLSQVLNPMDQLLDNPSAMASSSEVVNPVPDSPWDVRVEKDALHVRIAMPELEHQSTLKIKGEEEAGRQYSYQIELKSEKYNTDDWMWDRYKREMGIVTPVLEQQSTLKIKGEEEAGRQYSYQIELKSEKLECPSLIPEWKREMGISH